MNIEFKFGQQYVTRDGRIVELSRKSFDTVDYKDGLGEYFTVWTDNGKMFKDLRETKHDIVSEYIMCTIFVGKKYKNRDGAIVTCVRKDLFRAEFKTEYDSVYATWPNGLMYGRVDNPSGKDIVAEYIEEKPMKLKFVEGKKYLTDSGDIAVCKEVFSDNSMLCEIYGEIRAFNKDGIAFSQSKNSTLVSEYIELSLKQFDWTKPARTKNGKKVLGLTLLKGVSLENNLVGQLEGEMGISYWNSLGFNRHYNDNHQLENIPEKKVVPLEPGDIKPGYLIKKASEKDEPTWELVLGVIKCRNDKQGYYIATGTGKTLKIGNKLETFIISKDNGLTWENCFKSEN
jgi:hypothetical protein